MGSWELEVGSWKWEVLISDLCRPVPLKAVNKRYSLIPRSPDQLIS